VLVRIAVGVWAPRQRLGAIAVILDERGRVLVVEHALRVRHPWGFPGGWVERGEHPEHGLVRELREELGLHVEVGELLRCEKHGEQAEGDGPGGLTLIYTAPGRADRSLVGAVQRHLAADR
jgi:ADP-ribose pyrophosphatase YjhB (NUDIX family)